MEKEKKWIIWDYVNDIPFVYGTKKEALKDLRIFNKERIKSETNYFLFKRID